MSRPNRIFKPQDLYFIRIRGKENTYLHFEVYEGLPSFFAKEGYTGAPAWTKEKGKAFIKLMPIELELVPCADVINAQLPPAKELPYA